MGAGPVRVLEGQGRRPVVNRVDPVVVGDSAPEHANLNDLPNRMSRVYTPSDCLVVHDRRSLGS